MELKRDNRLVNNFEFFNEEYLPHSLIGRDNHIKQVAFCISPAAEGEKAIHAWIHGRPGTGKTSVCRHILNNISNTVNIQGVYVNCWENPSFFSILDKIIRDLRILGADKLNKSFKYERFCRHIQDKPFIIFLDEIDKIPKKDMDDVLYNFCNGKNIGIVAISNSRYSILNLDERVRSRLNAQAIEFQTYSEKDIESILSSRAMYALIPKSYTGSIIKHIAKLSDGDARVALQTLRNSAYLAENNNENQISFRHVEQGYSSAKGISNAYNLSKLTKHHRILYTIIIEKGKVLSGDLWNAYIEKCGELKIQPIANRTFSDYINKLADIDAISTERALVKGKVRVIRAKKW